MPTLDQILSADLPRDPTFSLPHEKTSPRSIAEIQQRRADLEPLLKEFEAGKAQTQRVAEAGRLRRIQLEEEAASKKERGLLEIEAKRPIPKELPEFVPPKQTFDELFSMLMVGIGTGTGAGRGNYMIAANAMIGAMEGYQKGKKDQLNNAIKEFDIAVKRANQEEKINTAKYNQIAANDKIALGEKIRQISLQAKAVDDRVMSAIARTGDFDKVIKEVTRRNDSYDKIEQKRIEAEDKLREHNRRLAESRADAATRRTPQLVEVKLADGTKEVRDLNRMKFDESGRPVLGAGESIIGKAGTAKDDDLKIPPKEISQGNDLRTRLIPELEAGLSTLERLHKEGKWTELTIELAIDPRLAEYRFRDDPEAIKLIRTFSLFRSKEFETAGKALTKTENTILSPLYQADLRVYEGVKNAMEKGIEEMKKTNANMEATYPFIKALNEQRRRDREQTAAPPTSDPLGIRRGR